jgi:hypothetical protein
MGSQFDVFYVNRMGHTILSTPWRPRSFRNHTNPMVDTTSTNFIYPMGAHFDGILCQLHGSYNIVYPWRHAYCANKVSPLDYTLLSTPWVHNLDVCSFKIAYPMGHGHNSSEVMLTSEARITQVRVLSIIITSEVPTYFFLRFATFLHWDHHSSSQVVWVSFDKNMWHVGSE